MIKKIKQIEEISFERTLEKIHIPKDPPKMVLIVGPCRVGTTALSNVFAHAGYTAYMQPIKSIRRGIEEGVEVPDFHIASMEEVVVCKETFGAKTQSEYYNPIEILIKAGYPKNKIHLIGIVRDPATTLTSWTWMWDEVLMEGFVRAYRNTEEVLEYAKNLDIGTTSYVHEAIRDNNSELVIAKLFNRISEERMGTNATDWSEGPNFNDDKNVKFFDEPPERFVHAVKTWGGYEYRHLIPDITEFQKISLRNGGVYKTYDNFLRDCELELDIKIRRGGNLDNGNIYRETKDTGI